jgi:hypothetical protein
VVFYCRICNILVTLKYNNNTHSTELGQQETAAHNNRGRASPTRQYGDAIRPPHSVHG